VISSLAQQANSQQGVELKILIVEDSMRLRKTLVTGLTKLGYAVDSSGEGHEALSLALSYDYDLIILDLMLPGLDGLTILKRLREVNKTNVLILSARDQIEDRVKGLNLGADDYLVKPFAFDELQARINALIRRSYNVKESRLRINDVCIDFAMREVLVHEEKVPLTPNEYSIVEILSLNRGRVITYDSLENHLYASHAIVSRNAIEAHMSSLRRKLRCRGVESLIQTKRGFGYFIR